MRSLISYRQEAFQSASSRPGPPEQITAPVNPTEMKLCLDALGVSSSEEGPPPGSRPGWLKVQLERLKQFLVMVLRVTNYRP